MFTIVSVYNKRDFLDKYLLKSLQAQNIDYELILLDSQNNKYSSAAQALNAGFKQSKKNSKYIIFIHQDIELPLINWLEKAEKILDQISDLGIAGTAGMITQAEKNSQRGRGIVKHGIPLREWEWGTHIEKPTKVQTLDESLVIIPRTVFKKLQFDEQTCDNWHLYAVDYSLSIKNQLSLDAYALPLPINHYSTGSVDKNYKASLKKILQKHKKNYKKIYTTCGDFSTRYPLFMQLLWDRFSIE